MKKMRREALLYLLPGLIGTLFFYVVPFIGGAYYALQSDSYPPRFVGLNNFCDLFHNNIFWNSLWNTTIFSILCAPIAIILALTLACYLQKVNRSSSQIRMALLTPYVLPTAAVVSIYKIVFGYNSYTSAFMSSIIGSNIDLLQSRWQILPIIFLYVWRNVGFFTIIILSAVQVIADNLYDYADIEGASAIQKHLYVTIPIISPSLLTVYLFAWTGALKVFKEAYALNGGYPPSNIYTLQHFINNHLSKLNYSIVTSASYVFALLLILVFTFLFSIEKRVRDSLGGDIHE